MPLQHLPPVWRVYLLICLIPLLYFDTAASIVSIWIRSETFTHGFLIVPISFWLIWQKRHQLSQITIKPCWPMLVALTAINGIWALAHIVDVLVVKQLALFALIFASCGFVFGIRLIQTLLFPLGFLIFAVPFGENLIPILMTFTAEFTVMMVQMTNIPIYQEGLSFSLPSGNWSVVQACSGIRYLIASVAMGSLYAYLTYSKLSKRLLFVLVAFIVPIIANGLRAFMIVMIGHFSDMTLATGVDHLIYGWLFFGLIIFTLFYIGSLWADPMPATLPKSDSPSNKAPQINEIIAIVTTFISLTIWLILPQSIQAPVINTQILSLSLPDMTDDIIPINQTSQWTPHIKGATKTIQQRYMTKTGPVTLYLGYFPHPLDDQEVISKTQQMIDPSNKSWRLTQTRQLETPQYNFIESTITGPQNLRIWHSYFVADQLTSNLYQAKLQQAYMQIFHNRWDISIIAIATAEDEEGQHQQRLTEFADNVIPKLREQLNQQAVLLYN